jgi:hypothetical protein
MLDHIRRRRRHPFPRLAPAQAFAVLSSARTGASLRRPLLGSHRRRPSQRSGASGSGRRPLRSADQPMAETTTVAALGPIVAPAVATPLRHASGTRPSPPTMRGALAAPPFPFSSMSTAAEPSWLRRYPVTLGPHALESQRLAPGDDD